MELKKTRYIPNIYPDYDPAKTDMNLLYFQLGDTLISSLQEFYKKVNPTEPIAICSVKSKSTYKYSVFDGILYYC